MRNRRLLLGVGIACILIVLLAPSLAPCAESTSRKTMTIAVPDPKTTGYMFGVALGKLIEEKMGIRSTVTVGSTVERVRLTSKGVADIGISANNATFYEALRGIGDYASDGKQNVLRLIYQYSLGLNIIARTDRNIKTIPDLRGKRFMYLDKGNISVFVIPALLGLHKMTLNDITGLKMGTAGEGFNALLSGSVDAAIRMAGWNGAASIKEGALKANLNWLGLTRAEVDHVLAKYPFLGEHTLPAGVYKGQDTVTQVADDFSLVVNKDMPEDLVYNIAKILLDTCGPDTPGQFAKFHPDLSWTLNSQQTFVRVAPVHPGVVKYLKDRKFWTAEMAQAQEKLLKVGK